MKPAEGFCKFVSQHFRPIESDDEQLNSGSVGRWGTQAWHICRPISTDKKA